MRRGSDAPVKNYQDKPVRRGTPSERYRTMRPYPTTAKDFGKGQFVSMSGVEYRVADGTDKAELVRAGKITNPVWGLDDDLSNGTPTVGTQLMYYRIPRRTSKQKRTPPPFVGQSLGMVHASTGNYYIGRIAETQGYRVSSTGSVILKGVRLTSVRPPDAFVERVVANARGAMTRRVRSALKRDIP